MNKTVLTKSKMKKLKQFGIYLENISLTNTAQKSELRGTLKALNEMYKEMIEQIEK